MRVWLGRGLVLLGIALLGFWLGAILDARLLRATLSRRLEDLASRVPSHERFEVARATRREARRAGLVGRISIPRLKLSAMIVEGAGPRALGAGVGHVANTAFPGEPGNVGLAGHRDTYFRKLRRIHRGDRIRVRTPDGEFAYAVESISIVGPRRTDLLDPTDRRSLTLVTCYPFYWVGPAPQRFVVRAREVDSRGAGVERGPAASRRSAPGRRRGDGAFIAGVSD